jgi:hypothetical protein
VISSVRDISSRDHPFVSGIATFRRIHSWRGDSSVLLAELDERWKLALVDVGLEDPSRALVGAALPCDGGVAEDAGGVAREPCSSWVECAGCAPAGEQELLEEVFTIGLGEIALH